MKIRAATTNKNVRLRRGWFTAAALLPLLTACSTDDLSGLWFGAGSNEQSLGAQQPANMDQKASVEFNRAACGLFFGPATKTDQPQSTAAEIPLDRTPQENLIQAISFDMDGDYANARKLYVWLTASPPENKVNLDCGQGIKLSGNISSLAQRRLKTLDESAPQFARSHEIDTVVAAATVAPGPELPDPPKVERDRRFYETGGVTVAAPEDSTKPIERMNMEVSANTAQLTKVEPRISSASAPAPQTVAVATPSSTMLATSTAATPQMVPVPVSKLAETDAASEMVSVPVPMVDTPTIAGTAESVEHDGAVVATNSRPIEQGQLEVVDREPSRTMIELPMASQSEAKQVVANQNTASSAPRIVPTAKAAPVITNGPYYAVQLAAYRSRGRAEDAWAKFQSSSRGVLSNAEHEVVTIAIEGQGLFFRLLTGKYSTQAEAISACGQLKSVGLDCLIRRVTP